MALYRKREISTSYTEMRGEIVFIVYDHCQNIEKPNNLEVAMSKVNQKAETGLLKCTNVTYSWCRLTLVIIT